MLWKRHQILVLTIAVFAIVLMLTSLSNAQDKKAVITIDCQGATVIVNPDTNRIAIGQQVMFSLVVGGGCGSVSVNGVTPIDAFSLSQANPSKVVGPFTSAGTYAYTVTKTSRGVLTNAVIIVQPSVPSLTTYGIFVLILLLLISTVWVLRRKRVGASA